MTNMSIEEAIEQLIFYANSKLSLKIEDNNLVRNKLLFDLKVAEPGKIASSCDNFNDVIDFIVNYAEENNIITHSERLLFETRIIGDVMPMSSQVIEIFDNFCVEKGIKAALDWFYNFCKDCNYIRMVDLDKNIYWSTIKKHGEIGITINLSKPEKDPKDIAAALKVKKAAYPKCLLCPENEGFYGNLNHPARVTLRTIPIMINDEYWHFQFSPYLYYEQHCIAFSDEHRNMNVNSDTYKRLFDFIELFPDYFIGSNASLPIVGGSILTHEHYQGGAKVLPLMKAKDSIKLYSDKYPTVKISIVDWYNSVIRVCSGNRQNVLDAVNYIVDTWNDYSDPEVDIISKTDAQHNAVTPIARFEEKEYCMDIILRNNRTDEKHPFGIFHPTEDLHNIKKEGIGLIEAMGRFILPGRLSKEAENIKNYLTGITPLDFKSLADPNNPMSKHMATIAQLVNDHGTSMKDEDAGNIITEYINNACEKILNCTAVFKDDEKGQKAFMKFIKALGFIKLDEHLEGKDDKQIHQKKKAENDEKPADVKKDITDESIKENPLKEEIKPNENDVNLIKESNTEKSVEIKEEKKTENSEQTNEEQSEDKPKRRGRPKKAE